MIQYICGNPRACTVHADGLVVSPLDAPRSPGEFEINVVDLDDMGLWCHRAADTTSIDGYQDLVNLHRMIENNPASRILILLPQDGEFRYNIVSGTFRFRQYLKNMLDDVRDIVGDLWPCVGFTLSYENTTTRVGKCQLPASFHFILPPAISSAIPGDNPFAGARRPADRPDVLLRSVKSEKITALKNDRVAFCTLRVESYPQLEELLLEIGYLPKPCGQQLPDWLAELTAFDDAARREQIARSRETIARLEAGIDEARQALERNNRYKSVLVESGDALVSVVFEMLERILDVDLSHFKDDFREDFRVDAGDVTLIGEIKGVSTNVRSEHVSQLEVHVQSYLDELRDEGREETVRALLIIAHERSKPLADRQPVSEAQVALARRNGSLIVETRTLLRLFERVTDGTLSHEQARRILTENTGLLGLES